MATLSDLENAIDALLDHPLGIGQYQLVQQVEEKAYEAYVFGLCLRAVRELGVTPVLCGISCTPAPGDNSRMLVLKSFGCREGR